MKKVLLLSIITAFSFAACKKDQGVVVAKVGGTEITDTLLAEKLQNTPPAYQNFVNTSLGRRQFIEAIVRENIMLEAAKQAGVNKKSEYTSSLEDFKREQERQLGEYRDGLLIEMYLREMQSSILASETDIEQYYNENKQQFDAPVAYTVRHILVTDRAEAEMALARIEGGESFENVAREVSQDTGSVASGGLIGPFKRGELVPEFEKVALDLKLNEMSGIVETSYGFHIIFKVSEENLSPVSFEEAKQDIKRTIEKERFDNWFEATRQRLGVTVDYAKAESVNITLGTTSAGLPAGASLEM